MKAKGYNGNGAGTPLAIAGKLWATPTVVDSKTCRAVRKHTKGGRSTSANAAMWATPTARDWRSGEASDETHNRNARPLNEQAVRLWPTATAQDASSSSKTNKEGKVYGKAHPGTTLTDATRQFTTSRLALKTSTDGEST